MKLGEWNILRIDRIKDVGAYLTDGHEDVLLPAKQVPADVEVGDNLEVFLYRDSEDRMIATVHTPLITIGELKHLRVKSVTDIGAFMDWGLERDLFMPFGQQTVKAETGRTYLVKLYVDKTGRLAASMKISDVLQDNDKYVKGDRVTGTIYNIKHDFGAFVAIDDKYKGLIRTSEIYQKLCIGDTVECRVSNVRPDGKTDLSMREEIPTQMLKDSEMVYDILRSYGSKAPFGDKSSSDVIRKEFGISKNAFKRALGHLLKEGRIEVGDTETSIIG